VNTRPSTPRTYTRRDALRLAGGAGLAAALAGHNPQLTAAQDDSAITIPDTGANLPTGDVTFRALVQGTGPRTPFYEAFFPAYQAARPNITVQYEELPEDQIQQVLPISVQNGNAHDLFMLGGALSTAEAVSAGWVAPLDDVIPDFATWKSRFPPGVFLEGVTVFGGQTYTFPLSSNQRYGTLLFINQQHLQQAGIDVATQPLSWEQFRAAARTLTEQGQGQYYGLTIGAEGGVKFAEIVTNLAVAAGAAGSSATNNIVAGPIDWRTGEYIFTSDQMLAAIDLLLALHADGSVLPGGLSLTQRQAVARMPAGQAAMSLDGPWVIARWATEAPDFQFGLGSQPVQNSFVPLGYEPGGANPHFIYAQSQAKEVAGDIFAYWGSPEGQAAFQSIVGGTLRAILPEASQGVEMDAASQRAVALFDEQMRLHPDPRARNPEVAQVFLEVQRLQPTFAEVMQGLVTGQLDDPAAAMQDLKDRADAELERAIKAAQDNGAQVSRDDWVFPNWDPTRDYTEADYAAL
jgi:multiple sugar transport system substrate-binding protein